MRTGYSGGVMQAGVESLQTQDAIVREDHFVQLYDASWEDYERLLAIRGEKSVPRITYLEGTLEIMSPSRDHEKIRSLLGRLVEAWCIDRGIELTPYGSWTLKKRKKQRGAEPDECYVFGTEPRDQPQLAIEVEWTRAGLNKLDVYCKLGVAEVWYWRKGIVEVHLLRGDVYERAPASALLPDLDLALLASFLDRATLTQAVSAFRAAIQKGR
jgi:Uma2 family endonuclease